MEEIYGVTPAVLHCCWHCWCSFCTGRLVHGDDPQGYPPVAYFYNLHKSIGIVAALPLVLLIWWRMTHIPPRSPYVPQWEARAAHINHVYSMCASWCSSRKRFHRIQFTRFGINFFAILTSSVGRPHDLPVFNRLHVYTSHFFVVLIAIQIVQRSSISWSTATRFSTMLPAKSQF